MPDLKLDLDLLDVDGHPIVDPRVWIRLVAPNGGAGVWRVALRGERVVLSLPGAPAGPTLTLRATPTRYRDIALVCQVTGDRVRPVEARLLKAPRRPSEWRPLFTRWTALADTLDTLRRVLTASPRFRLGSASNPEPLAGDSYDAVASDDESRALAKMCLLNLYSRLQSEPVPATGRPWFTLVRELLLADRERIIAVVDEACAAAVRTLAAADLGPVAAGSGGGRAACETSEPDLFRRQQCYRASAGHPNAHGAHAYARAIVAALAGVGV